MTDELSELELLEPDESLPDARLDPAEPDLRTGPFGLLMFQRRS